MTEKMTISRLAAAAGVNVETVRFYQRSGLIAEPIRPVEGYRTYGDDDVSRIRFIKRAQLLGFALDEIAILLKLEGARTCADTRDLAAKKLAMVEAKIGDLLAIKTALATMVARCATEDPGEACPIIQTLIGDRPGPIERNLLRAAAQPLVGAGGGAASDTPPERQTSTTGER